MVEACQITSMSCYVCSQVPGHQWDTIPLIPYPLNVSESWCSLAVTLRSHAHYLVEHSTDGVHMVNSTDIKALVMTSTLPHSFRSSLHSVKFSLIQTSVK